MASFDTRCVKCQNMGKCVTAIHAGESFLYVATESTIKQCNIAGEVPKFKGHTDYINCLLEHAEHIWSGSDDDTTRLWNICTGQCVKIISRGFRRLCVWQNHIVGA